MYIPSKKFAVMLGFWWAVSPSALQGSCLFLSPTAVQVDKSPWASPEEADVNCNIQCPPLIIKDLILIGQLICLFIQTTLGITIFAIFSPSVLEGTSVKQINNRPSPRRRQESIYFLNVSLLLCNLHVQDLDNPRAPRVEK